MDIEAISKALDSLKQLQEAGLPIEGVLYAVTAFIVLSVFANFFDILGRIFGAAKNAFVYLISMFRGGVAREHLERRRQFLTVLETDLAGIGKAESWNDQNFTDLEAEVQIEGGYYASYFDQLLKRKSFGRRKEPSLMGAIDGSVER